MRIERNLSQEGLAALLPKKPHLMWVSRVERGTQNVVLADLGGLAQALQVKAAWLVEGDAYQSEFAARLGGMEEQLDERGKRNVLTLAMAEVEESKKRADLLSEEEMEILRLYRVASPTARRLTRGGLQSEEAAQQPAQSERPAAASRQERTA